LSIKEAFAYALKIKKKSLNDTSYMNFEGRINRFKKALDENAPITSLNRKQTNEYLNSILETTSARNRNNTRIDLSSLFEVLANDEIITENFIKRINTLKTKPQRNKTYTPDMQETIYSYLEKNDALLLLFIKFISYNFLRPVEVCRLKVGDLDVKDKKLYVRAKNKLVKIKIIPEILIKDLPDLTQMNKEDFLFTPTKIGGQWIATENNRRDHFSKRFKSIVKDHFGLGSDYGMYSFRHTFITKLYRELRKSYSPFEAKSILMNITGHSTMSALELYLRDIDAELPEDYSHLLE
jgi:integrase